MSALWSTTLLIAYLLRLSNGEYFNLWDYCTQNTTDCVLDPARYAYGSGYQQNSSKWYLTAGLMSSFVAFDTVAIINIPEIAHSLTGYECSTIYNSTLPHSFSQNVAAVIDDELYSFGGFREKGNYDYTYMNNVHRSDISDQSAFSMIYIYFIMN